MIQPDSSPISERELVLERLVDVAPDKLFRVWTEPELLVQWFTPKPWTTSSAQLDVRPGGSSLIIMRSPEGHEFPNRGIYLDIIKNKRIVFTDAFIDAWAPSEKPFMTATITFNAEGGQTKYVARVQHWSVADREAHEKMGFHEGWSKATDQLVTVASKLLD